MNAAVETQEQPFQEHRDTVAPTDYRTLLGNLTFNLRELLSRLKSETSLLVSKGSTPEVRVWIRRWTPAIDVWALTGKSLCSRLEPHTSRMGRSF
jgi:hypothetical protein